MPSLRPVAAARRDCSPGQPTRSEGQRAFCTSSNSRSTRAARFLRWIGADYRRAISPGLPAVLLVLAATLILSMVGLLTLAAAAVVAALGGVGAFVRVQDASSEEAARVHEEGARRARR